MRVCFFGNYNALSSRSRILKKGLLANNVEIIECISTEKGILARYALVKRLRSLKSFDVILVGSPGHMSVLLAKIFSRKPVVFDAFFSLYDTAVYDRKVVKKYSLTALRLFCTDWISLKTADFVISDTDAHIRYFVETFKINRKKCKRILVGSDSELIYPERAERKDDVFRVHFHGTYIPLQGVAYIIDAASLLKDEDIQFTLVGTGQTYEAIQSRVREKKLQNISFVERVPYDELKHYMSSAHISLGIFGLSPKAQRVIPNKVFESLAAGSATITGRSPAVTELFEDGTHVLLCNMGDGTDLAEKILLLKNNTELREAIAKQGHQRFLQVATHVKVGSDLASFLQKVSV